MCSGGLNRGMSRCDAGIRERTDHGVTAHPRRSTACGPWPAGASALADRPLSPSEPENHVSGVDAGYLVGTYAYPSPSLSPRETSNSISALHIAGRNYL